MLEYLELLNNSLDNVRKNLMGMQSDKRRQSVMMNVGRAGIKSVSSVKEGLEESELYGRLDHFTYRDVLPA